MNKIINKIIGNKSLPRYSPYKRIQTESDENAAPWWWGKYKNKTYKKEREKAEKNYFVNYSGLPPWVKEAIELKEFREDIEDNVILRENEKTRKELKDKYPEIYKERYGDKTLEELREDDIAALKGYRIKRRKK